MRWFSHNSDTSKLKELEARLETLETRFRGISVEWDDVYDKLLRTLQRISKSRAKLQELEAAEQPVEPTPIPTLSAGETPHGLLTDRQKSIQQQILRRRAGG
jgi:predicted nuclease with TOPRIM domain